MKSHVELLFQKYPSKYPNHLERDYKRILEKLINLWDGVHFESYFNGLVVSSRTPARTGFSSQVIQELVFLNTLRNHYREQNITLKSILKNAWAMLPSENGLSSRDFQTAIKNGDTKRVQEYLTNKFVVNLIFVDSEVSPLLHAVMYNQLEIASLLMRSGAYVNAYDRDGYTSLHWAALSGFTEMADLLLDQGAEIDSLDNLGCTPLILAVVRNQTKTTSLLLKYGANRDISSKESGCALDIAIRKERNELVSVLKADHTLKIRTFGARNDPS
jgi:tankyrase